MIPDELYIETEMHDISILYYVFFSFNTQFSGFFDSSLRAILKEVFVFDNFGTDKTFLKVGMDHSGTLWSFPSFFVGPGTYFLYTGSEISLQVQQFVGRFNETCHTRFFQADFGKKHLTVFVGFQFGDVSFCFSGYYQDFGKVRDTFIGLSTESAALGKKLGIEFKEDIVTYNLKVIDKLAPESTASMQKDIARGHESEVQGLLFDMITAAEEQGIDVPTYREVAKKFIKQ